MQNVTPGLRKAFIVGNASYDAPLTLKNPVNDAEIIAQVLILLGFEVYFQRNLDIRLFVDAVSRFANNLQGADTGVFYYAGHGAQVNGDNFLVPIGCEPSNSLDLETGAVKLQTLLDTLGNASVTSVFFLDCCRNNPLPRWSAKGIAGRALTPARGLASPTVPNGSFIAFSTMNDAVAEDGEGDNSVFTANLCKLITLPDASISNVMAKVRGAVRAATSDRQIPMEWSTLVEPYVFKVESGRINDHMDSEDEYWTYVKDANSLELLQSFILRFPSGKYRPAAIRKIDELKHIKWKQEAWGNTGKIILVAFIIGTLIVSIAWLQFTIIEDTDLVGGDISLPVDVSTTDEYKTEGYFGYFGCKLACVFTRSCKAFTYDYGTIEKTNAGENKDPSSCYLKNDYESREIKPYHTSGYIWRPRFDTGFRRDNRPDEKQTVKYEYDWDRVYVASTLLNADGTIAPAIAPLSTDPRSEAWQFGSQIKDLVKTVDSVALARRFRHGFTMCQSLCDNLPACTAFTYGAFGKTCKLLSGDVTILQHQDVELQFPAVISGRKIK